MICPHCRRGELVNPHERLIDNEKVILHTCNVCGRGWHQDKKKRWHSHFAADIETYSENGHTLIDYSTWHINEGNK
jgi:hypothetical protein